jgi:hypothetical protein
MFSLTGCSYIEANYNWNSSSFSSTLENDMTLANDNDLTHYTLVDKFIGTLNTFPPYFPVKILKDCLNIYTLKLHDLSFRSQGPNPLTYMKFPLIFCTYASFFRNNVTPTKQTNESDFLQLTGITLGFRVLREKLCSRTENFKNFCLSTSYSEATDQTSLSCFQLWHCVLYQGC